MQPYEDSVFAPLDEDNDMVRIGGGNETEVYRTDDSRYAVKVKQMGTGSLQDAIQMAFEMRVASEQFAECLGPRHSIPTHYIISRNTEGEVHVVAIQPLLKHARPLYEIDYAQLSMQERQHIALELQDVIRRALHLYRDTGSMPDIYGRTTRSPAERKKFNAPSMLPWRVWGFLVKRNLLRSCNLLLTDEPTPRIILIDYDTVQRSKLYRATYFAVRWVLFWRDHALIRWMRRGGKVPHA